MQYELNLTDTCKQTLGKLNKELVKDKNVLIALSGGKDSVFLLYALLALGVCKSVHVAHINHSLRGDESDQDEKFCEALCARLGVNFSSKRVDVLNSSSAKGQGIEHAARKLRYAALSEIAKKVNADVVVTAHTLNDNIDTLFVDILTGSSPLTVGGIRKDIRLSGIDVVRPILTITTTEILNFLDTHNLDYRFDSSNNNTDYVRNYVRQYITYNITLHDKFCRNIVKFQAKSEELNNFFEEQTNKVVIFNNDFITIILNEKFILLQNEEKKYIILKVLCSYFRATKEHYSSIAKLYNSSDSRLINLPSVFVCEKTNKFLCIYHNSLSKSGVNVSEDKLDVRLCDKLDSRLEDKQVVKPKGSNAVSISSLNIPLLQEMLAGKFVSGYGCECDAATSSSGIKDCECVTTLYTVKRIEFKGDLIDKELIIRTRLDGDLVPYGSSKRKLKDLLSSKKYTFLERDNLTVVEDCATKEILYAELLTKSDNVVINYES